MYRLSVILILSSAFFFQQGVAQIDVRHFPAKPFIEKLKGMQVCNFDFIISNQSADSFSLSRIMVSLYDRKDNLLQQKFIDGNGTAPSINTIPNAIWNGKEQHTIFNPFSETDTIVPVHYYVFEMTFNANKKEVLIKDTVVPVLYLQSGSFSLPLQQRFLVYDAHDFLAHHRRFDYEFRFIKEFGFGGNFMRYAYDFSPVNEKNERYRESGERNEDWFAFGSSVHAVAPGKVVAIMNTQPDNKEFNVPELKTNPLALFGNYVVIEHAKGVYSMYAHLKQNSVRVKTGDIVKKSQQIGSIGVSGSSFFPHLHFEMRNSLGHDAEGLPSYFSNYNIVLGDKKIPVKQGTVTTGDIVEPRGNQRIPDNLK